MHLFFGKIFYIREQDLIEFQFSGFFFSSSGFGNLQRSGFFSGLDLENQLKLVEFSSSGKLDQGLVVKTKKLPKKVCKKISGLKFQVYFTKFCLQRLWQGQPKFQDNFHDQPRKEQRLIQRWVTFCNRALVSRQVLANVLK